MYQKLIVCGSKPVFLGLRIIKLLNTAFDSLVPFSVTRIQMKIKEKLACLMVLIQFVLNLLQHVLITAGAFLIEYNPEIRVLVKIINERGHRISNIMLRKWTLYAYCPDQSLLTHRFIGKPDLAHSPP